MFGRRSSSRRVSDGNEHMEEQKEDPTSDVHSSREDGRMVDTEDGKSSSLSGELNVPSTDSSSSQNPDHSVPAAAAVEADELVAGDGTHATETKYERLHHLLDKTSLFSKFLSERMPQRFSSIQSSVGATSAKGSAQKASHLAERTAELKQLIAQNAGLELHPFQIAGVDWLISLYENGLNGILADEMGLGKTVQVILFLAFLRKRKVFGPFLIVAPLGTLPAWKEETKRWTPQTPVIIYHGDKASRAAMRSSFIGATIDENFPVIVTSYEIAMADASFLKRVHWKLLCVDEGHRLKNIECLLIQRLKQLPSENRLLLTGTPLQNSLPELWSLLHFLLPDVFASLSQFQSWFDFDDQNLEQQEGQQYLINQERDHLLVSKLHSILRPFVLRRVKSEVLTHLSEKKEYTLYVPMTPLQRLYYQSILDGTTRTLTHGSSSASLNVKNVLMQLRKIVNHPYLLLPDEDEARMGVDMEMRAKDPRPLRFDSTHGDDEDESKEDHSIPLEKLREHFERRSTVAQEKEDEELQALGPPSEEDDEEDESDDEEYRSSKKTRKRSSNNMKHAADSADAPEPVAFESIPERNKRRKLLKALEPFQRSKSTPATATLSFENDPARLVRVCGKLELLSSLLPALRARKSRVLLFSQMTRVLDILEDFLVHLGAPKKFKYCRIDGTTSSVDRARQIKKFNEDENYFVFLLSTRAGGLGLNLAAADTVILYDTDWNPHNDAQAADRAHRLTQTRKVLVFRLVTPGSVEVGMHERASSKKKLEQVVLTKGRFNQRTNNVFTSPSETAASHWRQQQGIVSELVELFRMQPSTHQAIRTHLDSTPMTNAASSSSSPLAAANIAPKSNRRASLKRKSPPSVSASPPPETTNLPTTTPFDPAWIERLLQRDEPPPEDVLPQSSYEAGYAYVRQNVDKAGLLHALTDHSEAINATTPSAASGAK